MTVTLHGISKVTAVVAVSALALVASFYFLAGPSPLESAGVAVAVVSENGALAVYDIDADTAPQERLRWGSSDNAEQRLVDVEFADDYVLQLFDDGAVRAIELDGSKAQELVLWSGTATLETRAVAISFIDDRPAFLLADGSIRISSSIPNRAAGVLLWPAEPSSDRGDVTAFAGHDMLIGAVFDGTRVAILDPDEPENGRELAVETGSVITAITRAGDRVLVRLATNELLEFDLPSGVGLTVWDGGASGAPTVWPTGGAGWFGSQDRDAGLLEVTNGTTQRQVAVDAEAVWVHGNATTGAIVLSDGQVVGFGFADMDDGFSISNDPSLKAAFAGIVSSET